MKQLVLLAAALFAASAQGKTVFYGSERENISLSHGVETLLRFDEEVKTITQAANFTITPANPKSPDYKVLSVKPRSKKARSNVTFILASDVVVNLKFNTVTSKLHETTNTFYDFKAKHLEIDPITKAGKGSNISEVELMKAMIRADEVVGYKMRNLSQAVRSGVEGISARLVKIYSGPKYHGYVFQVRNTTKDQTFAIDVKSLTLGRPNVALLSQTDSPILQPQKGSNTTFLRIVAKPSSVYYAITLPVAPIKKSK